MQRHHSFRFGEHQCLVSVVPREDLFERIEPVRFFVSDSNTSQYLPTGDDARRVFPAGETSKSWEELHLILGAMLEAELTRDSTVVGVGGGVVGDITSLAASLYMRGCNLVLVPTTLLSMVDAAVGGKTGVNLGGFKNMVGTFYPAREVRLCPDLLHTLPEREYRSGLAEVVKTAMLGDEALLDLLEARPGDVLAREDGLLADIVWRCVSVKGATVEEDLRETGIRAHLNLGHTFAHALESSTGLGSWTHGEAVAWGLKRAMEAGLAAGITDPDYARRISSLLAALGYRTQAMPDAVDSLIPAMRKDKKRQAGANRFILQKGPCDTVVTELDENLLRSVLLGEVETGG